MTYSSLGAFYNDNSTRRRSGEVDFGVWWTGEEPWPKYRVSYIQDTSEIYATQANGRGTAEILGVVPPKTVPMPGSDLSMFYYMTLDRILDGWADHIGVPNSLAWVRERLKRYRPAP